MPFAAQKAIFDRLGSIAEIEAMDEPERNMYDESLRVFRDNIVVAKGEREAGREEGREEATITIAKKMKQSGLDIYTISEITHLTPEEIEKLCLIRNLA